jgi:hypothetical protein
MNTERLIRIAAARQASKDSKALPKPGTMRQPSNQESNHPYVPYGYYEWYCFHDKLWTESCNKCRRKASTF